jgi:protein-disulfide isomerase
MDGRRLSRRHVLAVAGAATAGVVAGCTGGFGGDGGDGDGSDGSGDGGSGTPGAEQLPPPVRGDPEAGVTLAVFEDFACPHCADYNTEGFPELATAYVNPEEIRYEHRDLPIPVADPGSFQAANAARAIQDRHGDGAVWTYAAVLFERSGDISAKRSGASALIAEEQGHDGDPIREAAVDRSYEATVRGDRQEAVDLGVESTPSFVVNGDIVASGYGSRTVDAVSAAIEEALSETG